MPVKSESTRIGLVLLLKLKTHNGVDSDVSGDYCTDCAGDIADAIRAYRERRDALLETHTTLEEAIANAN